MPVSDGEFLRLAINGSLDDGTKVMNRKTWLCQFTTQQTDAAVLNALETWVETLYAFVASQIDGDAALEQCNVDVIEWNAVDSIWEVARNVGVFTPTDTFANASDPLPNQCAAFVIGNTTRPKTKGRLFLFPFGEDTQDHGILGAGALTALGNFATQYITDQTIGAGNVLISGIVREFVNFWYSFQSVVYDDVIGTQRRRRFGVGT